MPKCNILLFAAGLGTRLRPHTEQHPKPALPLLDVPIGYYGLPYFNHLNVENFVVNSFHLPQQIHQLYSEVDSKIKFSDEKDFIKGSAGGLKQAEKLLCTNTEDILFANGDEVLFTQEPDFLSRAHHQHQKNNALATLTVVKHSLAGTKFGAIWTDKNQRVVSIGKEAPNSQSEPWHFIGYQFFTQKIFSLLTEGKESNIFYDVLIHHLNKEKVEIYPIQGDWYETGNLVDYTEAKKHISEKLKTQSHYQAHFESLKKLPRTQIRDLA